MNNEEERTRSLKLMFGVFSWLLLTGGKELFSTFCVTCPENRGSSSPQKNPHLKAG